MSNKLQEWEKSFRKGILKEIKSSGILFTKENLDLIVNESSFKVRTKKAPTFDNCPYVSQGKPCHSNIKNLNCFLCACPNYDSSKLDGGCNVGSKDGKFVFHDALPLGRIWDCSECSINHSPEEVRNYIENNFDQLKKQYDNLEV